jgi:curli biogenesis system outer membrane secretion channel CsgG
MARRLLAVLVLSGMVAAPLAAQQGRAGPKVRIAMTEVEWDPGVTQFASMRGNNSANVVVSEQATFARGLTEMMIAELLKTGRFIVVERKAMEDIQAEQQLQQAQGNRATQVNPGQLVGAQFLIRPTITEFSYGNQAGTQGGSVRAPISVPGLGRPRIGGGKAKITASLVLDTRLMDVESGQITSSVRSASEATQEMNNFSLGTALFDYKKTDFEKTPLGAATREAVADAVQKIVGELGDRPWEGRVVTMRDGQVYLNAGAETGIKAGDELDLVRAGEALIDPATGINLGSAEEKLGRVRVTSVQEKFSIATPLDGATPERGDIVRYPQP